jgi:predicted lipoprotein with Yx(FWY)xxD motif
VRAAEEAETVLAEEAAMMAEALADIALAMTIATADADNCRQQATINNRLREKPCLVVATTEVASWRWWQRQRQRWRQQWLCQHAYHL